MGELTNGLQGKYKVMLFPCNQFLGQEPGMPTSQTIKEMSTGTIEDAASSENVILMAKIEVNGVKAHPVYDFLKYNSSLYDESKHLSSPVPWNFAKFLVDPEGGVFKYYGPKSEVSSIKPDLESLLSSGASGASLRRRPTVTMQDTTQ